MLGSIGQAPSWGQQVIYTSIVYRILITTAKHNYGWGKGKGKSHKTFPGNVHMKNMKSVPRPVTQRTKYRRIGGMY